MKQLVLGLIITMIFSMLFTQTSMTAGDLAIIGVNCDNEDDFAFILFTEIEAGTNIKFTDNGWQADDSFRTGENIITFTAANGYQSGEVIIYSAHLTEFSGTMMALSTSGDQILVYQGNESDPTFLFAINIEGDHVWQSDASSTTTSAIPLGLTNQENAVALQEYDNVIYNGSVNFNSISDCLASICNYENWLGDNSERYDFSSFSDFALPLTLSDFTATVFHNEYVSITWVTQSESNMSHYNLYRNELFLGSRIATNTSTTMTYQFIDPELENGADYAYRLEAVELDGTIHNYGPYIVHVDSYDMEIPSPDLPEHTGLIGNYPNPFNPRTVISFSVQENETATLRIFNIRGKQVTKKKFITGKYNYIWESNKHESGIYFYQLTSPSYSSTKKMVMLK